MALEKAGRTDRANWLTSTPRMDAKGKLVEVYLARIRNHEIDLLLIR